MRGGNTAALNAGHRFTDAADSWGPVDHKPGGRLFADTVLDGKSTPPSKYTQSLGRALCDAPCCDGRWQLRVVCL
jgi:hypothetical protein